MKRLLTAIVALGVASTLIPSSARAASNPVIEGQIAGIELFPQFLLGSAGFFGNYNGRIGIFPQTSGAFFVDVQHDDLPAPGGDAAIRRGTWWILGGFQFINGDVTGGTLHNNGDDTFSVFVTLRLSGNRGEVYFYGTL